VTEPLTVDVPLGPRSYAVRIASGDPAGFGPFAREALDATWAGRGCRAALTVVDANVGAIAGPFEVALRAAGIEPKRAVVPAGEASKSIERAIALYDVLVDMNADRQTTVVAIGGGVAGDLAGFVAATYNRGLPLLMVPTTLLAQVDSAVGGKVAVNHPRAKNVLGAFHQPRGVWIDTETLATLPDRELRCGLAEVVKYGAILDPEFFDWLEANAPALLARDPSALRHVIAVSCRLKAGVVAADEREESGVRAVLNFGHTIGHAIEATAGYGGDYRHGEAVAVGMVAECRLAETLGWIGPETTDRLAALLGRLGLPVAAPGLDPSALAEAMGRDKKNRGGQVRFVLPRAIGRVELAEATAADALAAIRADPN